MKDPNACLLLLLGKEDKYLFYFAASKYTMQLNEHSSYLETKY